MTGPSSFGATAQGLWAARSLSWEVQGTTFLPLPAAPAGGRSLGFQGWVDSMSSQEREEGLPRSFLPSSASQAETLSELSQSWADSALAVVEAYAALPPETRRDMLAYLWRFLVNMGTGGAVSP